MDGVWRQRQGRAQREQDTFHYPIALRRSARSCARRSENCAHSSPCECTRAWRVRKRGALHIELGHLCICAVGVAHALHSGQACMGLYEHTQHRSAHHRLQRQSHR